MNFAIFLLQSRPQFKEVVILKILVAAKRVMDYRARVRVLADGSDVDVSHAKKSMNPFDEIALARAIEFRNTHPDTEIVVVSIGSENQDVLKHALAMGADNAIWIQTDETQSLSSLAVAKILKKITEQEKADWVLLGKQSTDGDNNQVGQMLAGLLNWSQATFAMSIEYQGDSLVVTREVDRGQETVSLRLPAVVTADLRLAKPMPPTLPAIMKAKAKPVCCISYDDLSLASSCEVEVLSVMEPEVRSAGERVASVQELLYKLRHEAKVLP